jgi:DNA-binding NarL/FixJ family response regulator
MSWKEFLEEVAAGKKFHAGEDREWPISKLTPAETNVLIEILPTPNGGALPQKEVATKLVIDVKTVKSHVDSIYDKFRVDKGGSRKIKAAAELRNFAKNFALNLSLRCYQKMLQYNKQPQPRLHSED